MMGVRRRTVLVVADAFLTGKDVATCLRETPYDVIDASDAHEAMTIIAAGTQIDAVLCNVSLTPDLEGHAFLQWIGLQYPRLPVLFTSMDRSAADLIDEGSTRRFVASPYYLGNIEWHLGQLIKGENPPACH